MKLVYQPRMELVKNNCTENVWQDWGIVDSVDKGEEIVRNIKREIKEGKWDNRKQAGYELDACLEVIDDDDFSLIEIIEYDN